MKFYNSILDYVGNTPLIKLNNIQKDFNLKSNIYAKCEMFNPSSSIKARIAKNMIIDALDKKIINKDTTIIEPTSGNTGIGLAMVCASLNMHFIAVMNDNMSIERRKLIKAYGGEVVLVSKDLGMKGTIKKAQELHSIIKNSYIPFQFENLVNPYTHYLTTAQEIYNDLEHNVDIIVSPIGSGGTISGIGKFLKSKNKDIKIIGIEPESSPLITKGIIGSHKIQGIGANFIPHTLDLTYVDEVLTISDDDAFKYSRMLAQKEGIFAGISSGASLAIGIKVAKEETNKNIVIILPDTGERYLSTPLVED